VSLYILKQIEFDKRLLSLEKDIIDGFNFIVGILSDPDVSYNSAYKYLENQNFIYFSVLSINNKIYVRQLTFNKSVDDQNILKKYY